MQKKILISDSMHESIVPLFESIGYQADYEPKITRQEIIDRLGDYTGIVVRSKTYIDRELISAGTQLQFIARSGAGVDLIDLECAAERSVTILNAPEGNRDAVAEHTLGLILNLFNKICQGNAQVRQHVWDREGNRGIELMHRTVGLIGYGYMGKAVAQRLSGFGCKVLAYDKYKVQYGDVYAQEATLEQIYAQADVVSFHVPLTEETRLYVNDDFLSRFEKPVTLINTARGEILSLKSLLHQLKIGKVLAAGLDVLENEKPKKWTEEEKDVLEQLFEMDNVIFTPHVAGWTVESYRKINETLVRKIKELNLV
jgi:D-3-phosphoglycerate dehydrogenase